MFKVAKFDNNSDGDVVCKQLFKEKTSKEKNKVKAGKVTKKFKKNEIVPIDEEKIKEEIRAFLQNNFDTALPTKDKAKKKNTKTEKEQDKILNKRETKNETSTEPRKKKRKKRKKNIEKEDEAKPKIEALTHKQKKEMKLREKLKEVLNRPKEEKKKNRDLTLRERMMQRLQAARFRFINEQIYSTDSKEAEKIFKEDPEAFTAYHEGYRQQVNKWPLNPVDVIIKNIQKLPKSHTVADFGCGEAKLAQSVDQKTHSFDLVATNDLVTACDMSHVPLQSCSVDVVVFCLSLMGTNLHDYLLEANRVLKVGGILKIAEVESRFDDVNHFIEALSRFHFKNTWKDLSHNLFYFLDFKKESNIKNKKKLPTVSLHPCLYKKR